jgi:predicted glycoside hydrolase/deacetylase ChbG (UPF0249 family)
MNKGRGTSHEDEEGFATTPAKHVDSVGEDPHACYGTAGGPRNPSRRGAGRSITICVDDYGLHAGINRAAIDLARQRRVSAIGCLTDGPAWSSGVSALRQAAAHVEVGVHLNFTENFGRGCLRQPLSRLIVSAYSGRLDRDSLRLEIGRQYDRVESVIGRPPDFIDGHQHVHQLPCVRDALMAFLRDRRPRPLPWLRSTRPARIPWAGDLPWSARLKSRVIASLGGAELSRLAAAGDCRQNGHLLGVYSFDATEARYLSYLRSWLAVASDGDLLMCHPSVAGPWKDPILDARIRECAVLSGDSFLVLTERAGIGIRPLARG